jgi:integrase
MARAVRNTKIDTRSARSRLPVRASRIGRQSARATRSDTRRGVKGGTWVARHRDEAGKQHYLALGAADDARDADGIGVFSFAHAQAKARAWFEAKAREMAGEPIATSPYTVADAMREYLDWYATHRKGFAFTRSASSAFILPALGSIDTHKLTKARIEVWLRKIAEAPARLRTKAGEPQRYRDTENGAEAARRRQSTANRVLTILKAALNRAFQDGRIASDDAWRRVKPFRGAAAARARWLGDDEAMRLVNACDPGFRPIVLAALLTGCRYSELAALRASDFNPHSDTLLIRRSKSGQPRHVILSGEGRELFSGLAAGKPADALLLPRPGGRVWGKSHQRLPMLAACKAGGIEPAVSFTLSGTRTRAAV